MADPGEGRAGRPVAFPQRDAPRTDVQARPSVDQTLGYFPSPELGPDFGPFADLRQMLGFVPTIFRAQTLLPRAIEAEAEIARAVQFVDGALPRTLKEYLLLAIAAADRNTYCVTAHSTFLQSLGADDGLIEAVAVDYTQAALPANETALLTFGLKLSRHPTWVSTEDVDALRGARFTDQAILEAVLVTALARFLCTLSTGLGVPPDFEPRRSVPSDDTLTAWTHGLAPRAGHVNHGGGPFLRAEAREAASFAPFRFFLDRFGFVPNVFRAQTLREDALKAEALAVANVLLTEDLLTRTQKESILLVISAANLNTYCVAIHCELLKALGVPVESSDQIAVDHHQAGLTASDCALLDMTLKLATRPGEFGPRDIAGVVDLGFTWPQALEAVVMTALTSFLNAAQMGLAPPVDFPPRRHFPIEYPPVDTSQDPIGAKASKPGPPDRHPTDGALRSAGPVGAATPPDEDAALARRGRSGDLEAFEELVRRHTPRVYRTIVSIVGSPSDADDVAQNTFLQAFRHLDGFEGRSRFSTWVTRIAVNQALQLLRQRRRNPAISLDARPEDVAFRPRNVQAWAEDPEQLLAREETRGLVRTALEQLPLAYRVVLTLQHAEGLPVGEVAEALGLTVAAVKTRAHRGRLMLREKLAPHFTRPRG